MTLISLAILVIDAAGNAAEEAAWAAFAVGVSVLAVCGGSYSMMVSELNDPWPKTHILRVLSRWNRVAG